MLSNYFVIPLGLYSCKDRHNSPQVLKIKKGMGVERDYQAAAAAQFQEVQVVTWLVEMIVERIVLLILS
jgi:hypothetical protein